ncbi:hypothetical protein I3760_16G056800 [Carya illinoinensis]|nr:hypothetical protein I3760_16G056800 [Carya illinoinensis]
MGHLQAAVRDCKIFVWVFFFMGMQFRLDGSQPMQDGLDGTQSAQ